GTSCATPPRLTRSAGPSGLRSPTSPPGPSWRPSPPEAGRLEFRFAAPSAPELHCTRGWPWGRGKTHEVAHAAVTPRVHQLAGRDTPFRRRARRRSTRSEERRVGKERREGWVAGGYSRSRSE